MSGFHSDRRFHANVNNNMDGVHFPAQQLALATTSQGPPLFGAVISGLPVRTDFVQVDTNKYACRLSCPGDITVPLASVTELVIFLFQPLPPQQGILCYWQMTAATGPQQESTGFELLGSLTPNNPSRIFHTGWGEHEQMVQVSSSNTPVILTLGLSVEPMDTVQNVGQHKESNRLFIAQKIAADLFRFLQSFDTGSAGPGQMVVPKNVFDLWYQRFESRLKRNPNFFLKAEED